MSYKYQIGQKYKSRNEEDINKLTDQYLNRDSFSYDPNADTAFQNYANMMMKQGNLAMKDTMGQAASMTGGYGNSYAQTAGQQVYNNYASQIGAAQSDFEDRAYSRYNAETNDLLSRLGILQDREASDKANWENDYAEAYADAQNKATYGGDYSGLAAVLGVSEDNLKNYYKEQSDKDRKPLTEDLINGYRDAIIAGNGEDYYGQLVAMRYDTDALSGMQDIWSKSGQIPGTFENDENDNPTYVSGIKSDSTINNNIHGPDTLNKGRNFHVTNTTGTGEANWNVQLGNEITDKDSAIYKYGQNNEGLFVYNGNLYYSGGEKVFSVEEQPWRKIFDGSSESDLETLIRLIGG